MKNCKKKWWNQKTSEKDHQNGIGFGFFRPKPRGGYNYKYSLGPFLGLAHKKTETLGTWNS
jgi:hypothetical protein